MIKDLTLEAGRVAFTIELTTPACPLRDQIVREARTAVAALPGVQQVDVRTTSNVRDDGRTRGLIHAPIRNAVAVASGKGGVGKTTVAVNVAVALARAGARVGLLDADVYGPNVPKMMGLQTMPPPRDGKMVPAEAFGVKVVSMAFLIPPDQPLIWRGPMLHSAIRQFIADVDWGELDYLIVDLPPGTGDAPLSLAQSLPLSGGLIVTLPQQVSLDDARRGLEMFRTMDVPSGGWRKSACSNRLTGRG
jgi:ATP-binding protein involved in chromosome partitioning